MADDDILIRLADILPIAFPHGGMTVSGLRRERDRGRLTTWRIAGKEFTTLRAIREMRTKCIIENKQPVCADAGKLIELQAAARRILREQREKDAAKRLADRAANLKKGRIKKVVP